MDFKKRFEALNHNLIDKTLDILYSNHPEAKIINVVINVEPNGKYDAYSLMTDFNVPIRNMDNEIVRVTSKWEANKVDITKIYSFDSNPILYPKIVCLENYWYSIDKTTVMDIAMKYGHDGVIVDNILKQNQELKDNLDKEIKSNISLINKNKYLTTQRNTFFGLSIMILSIYIYYKII
jgi:hypothetical protein